MIRGITCIIGHNYCVGWNWSYLVAFPSNRYSILPPTVTHAYQRMYGPRNPTGKKNPLQPLVPVCI